MSNFILTPPYQPFTLDKLFKGVFNGYIYAGVVNATAGQVITNQIQAYVEAQDGTLTEIPQPIRTNGGGFPIYNGEVVKVVFKSAFSLLVQDKNQNQIWYEPNMAFFDPQTALETMGIQYIAGSTTVKDQIYIYTQPDGTPLYLYDPVGDNLIPETPTYVVDGGIFNVYQPNIKYTAVANGLKRSEIERNNDFVSLAEFANLEDADHSDGIQAWVDYCNNPILNSSLSGFVPPGDWKITKKITIGATGNGGFLAYGVAGNRWEQMGSRFLTNLAEPAFMNLKDGTTFNGIAFVNEGDFQGSGTIALQNQKTDNTDDSEFAVYNCPMYGYSIGVKHYGRSCRIDGGEWDRVGVILDAQWVQDGTYPTPPNKTDLPLGYRAFVVQNIRAHTCGTVMRNITQNPESIRSVLLSNILMDLDGALFLGGLNNATITGCNVDIYSGTGTNAAIKVTSGGKNINIDCNVSGVTTSGADNDIIRSGAYGVRFDVPAVGCNIRANVSGFNNTGIAFLQGMQGSTVNVTAENNVRGMLLQGTIDNSNITYAGTGNDSEVNDLSTRNTSTLTVNGAIWEDASNKFQEYFSEDSGGVFASIEKSTAGTAGLDIVTTGKQFFTPSGGIVTPKTDGGFSLGEASRRIESINLINAASVTSSRAYKSNERDIDEAVLRAVRKVPFKAFEYTESINKKGGVYSTENPKGARTHINPMIEDIISAFESEGVDPWKYAVIRKVIWSDEPEVLNEDGSIKVPFRKGGERLELVETQWLSLKLAAAGL